MTFVEETICERCGLAVGPDAGLGRLCPRCLLRAALSPRAEAFPRAFGRYELREQLGRGGMGVVYRAYDPAAERTVALKVLKDGDLASDEDVARFQDEARKAAGLPQEGIVPVLDVGVCDGQPFFTMQLMEGGSLAARIHEYRGRPRAAAALVAEIARAVHQAHRRFVLHRDLKPANVLLDAAGRPHIADFGIARRLDRDTVTTSRHPAGTLAYMAPEQIQTPGDLDVGVDVYGLGAILYELLCDVPPIEGASAAELVKNVVDLEPVAPRRRLRPDAIDVDVDLDTICMKCLRKAPGDRYASAAGVAADLDRYLADEAIAARRPTTGERARRVLRRHPTAAALAGIALGLLLATTAAAVSVARTQEAELRAEALKVNAYAARALAGAVRFELRALEDDVSRLARHPAVRAVLQRPRDPAAIAAWRALPRPPLVDSELIVDTACHWIARAPAPANDRVGESFAWREYCAAATKLGRESRRDVRATRSYVSVADGTVRFSFVSAVYDDEGRWLGALQSAVDANTALGTLTLIDPAEPNRISALVARRDRDRPDEPLPDDWLVLLHDGMVRGSRHVIASRGALASLADAPNGSDDRFQDPIPGFGGRWLAGVAAVPGTAFAAIVQTRTDAVLAPNQRLASRLRAAGGISLAAALVACVISMGQARGRARARRRR